MRGWMLALGIGLLASAAHGQDGGSTSAASARAMYDQLGMGGLKGKKLKKAIEQARQYPLGSERNPVRVEMPRGQRAYLAALRCADGATPSFERGGSTGVGPYGYMLDVYAVTCPGKEPVSVYMDMYHDQPETQPVPGFTIAG